MPPGDAGAAHAIPQAWRKPDGSTTMALDIATPDGKATVRNWLACNAPVVAGVTGAPPVAASIGDILPPMSSGSASGTFQYVYDNILSGSCKGCHVKGGAVRVTDADGLLHGDDRVRLPGQPGRIGDWQLRRTRQAGGREQLRHLVAVSEARTDPSGSLWHAHADGRSTYDLGRLTAQSLCDWIKAGALP